ncbi:MAG: oligosaccharide flippase family protein [Vampirovibrionales bacterium]|nr:oligosaccharide flippase family protein [Vampirovibrionales bacterium]
MSTLKSNIASGIVTGVGGFFLKVVSGLILLPIVIRELGAESYGFYVFLFTIADILMALEMGITMGLIQRVSHYIGIGDEQKKNEQIALGQWLFLGIAILLLSCALAMGGPLGAWFIGFFKLNTAQQSLAPTILTLVFLDTAVNLYGCYYQSLLKAHCLHRIINLHDTTQSILFSLASITLLLLGYGLVEVFSARLAISMLNNLGYAFHTVKHEPLCFSIRSISFDALRDLSSISFYSLIQRTCALFSTQLDSLLIARFLTLLDVGVYGLVNRIFNYILMTCWKIIDTIFPVFTRFSAGESAERSRMLYTRISAFICFAVSLMLVLTLGVFPEIIQILGSGEIDPQKAWILALVIFPGIWSSAIASVSGNYLFASGRPKQITCLNLLNALMNFIISFFLVQSIGFIGPAVATTALNIVYHQWITITLACKTLELSRWDFVKNVYIRNALPLMGAGACLLLGRYAYNYWQEPIILILAFTMAMLVAVLLWLLYSTTSLERDFLREKVGAKLKNFLEKRPFSGGKFFKKAL